MKKSNISEIIEDIKSGKMVIIVDDESRENEGDLICAADLITPEIINEYTLTYETINDLIEPTLSYTSYIS